MVVYQVPDARHSDYLGAGVSALSVLTTAEHATARTGPLAYMFSTRKHGEHWQQFSSRTRRVKFPVPTAPLPLANAELADGYVKLAPDTKDFTMSGVYLHTDALLQVDVIKCKQCSTVNWASTHEKWVAPTRSSIARVTSLIPKQ